MRDFTKSLLCGALGATLLGAAGAHAFSFDFGDDDYYPVWGAPMYGPPGSGYYLPPRLSSYDRHSLKMNRQDKMSDHQDALNELSAMLYGGKGFDRNEAVQLARKIQSESGIRLSRNFHPGAVVTSGSRALPSVWQNQEAFKGYADSLSQAAGALAEALVVQPKPENAILLPNRNAAFNCKKDDEACTKVAVDPSVWEKFNNLSATCEGCHVGFRGFGWW